MQTTLANIAQNNVDSLEAEFAALEPGIAAMIKLAAGLLEIAPHGLNVNIDPRKFERIGEVSM